MTSAIPTTTSTASSLCHNDVIPTIPDDDTPTKEVTKKTYTPVINPYKKKNQPQFVSPTLPFRNKSKKQLCKIFKKGYYYKEPSTPSPFLHLSSTSSSYTDLEEMVPPAKSTSDSYKAATDMFNRFTDEYKQLQIPKFDDLTLEYLQQDGKFREITLQFSKFLLEDAKTKGGKHYASGSIPKYLSNWFTKLKKNTSLDPLKFSNIKEEWYDDVYQHLSLRAQVNAIKRGDAVKKRHLSIRRTLTKRIILHHLKKNKLKSDAFFNR